MFIEMPVSNEAPEDGEDEVPGGGGDEVSSELPEAGRDDVAREKLEDGLYSASI